MDEPNMEFPRPEGVDEAERRRLEKIALYGMRYGTSSDELMKRFAREAAERRQAEADRKRKRRQRWLRIWHTFVGHSHEMHFLNEDSLEWTFVCECGHSTKEISEADA